MPGGLTKLVIEAYETIKFDKPVADGVFKFLFNPASYLQKYELEFEEAQGRGSTASAQKFKRIKPRDFSLEFHLDGTGTSAEKIDVEERITAFLALTAALKGKTHQPYFLRIKWGTLLLDCILKSAEITYSLFDPEGKPIRAKVNASFSEVKDDEKRVREDDTSSPDFTHYHVVSEGETLPILSHRYYGDIKFYLDIARVNTLNNYRRLQAGTVLLFPPVQ